MSQSLVRYVVAACILFPSAGVSLAQPAPGHDAWLMRNYRFTGPPKPSELVPVAPVLMELREIQSSVRTILSRARLDGDYETALAAAAQAVENAQLMDAITERQQAIEAAQGPRVAMEEVQPPAPVFIIALKDKTINAAKSYWVDGRMLNYITLQDAHVIVRLDEVDRGLSRDLNRQRIAEFRLPE
jgi:hypothetical protein